MRPPSQPVNAADDDDDDLPPLVIQCDTASSAGTSWVFSLLVAGLAGYGAYSMSRGAMDWQRDWPILGAFIVVFPAIAGFLLLSSIWATMLWRKQGVTRLRIPAGHVTEGAWLRGTIECSRQLELLRPARVRLECLERREVPGKHHSDSKTRTETRRVWSQEQPIEAAPVRISVHDPNAGAAGTCFALEFRIPEMRRVAERFPTAPGVVGAAARVYWTLTLEAPTPGLDFEAHFDVPVLSSDAQTMDDGDS